MSATMKALLPAFIVCALVALGLIIWQVIPSLFYSGPVVRDTPFTREFNQVYRLTGKLVLSEVPPPKGPDSKRIEAFVAAGILSTNDVEYTREYGIEFHGFDGTRTGADVVVFEAVCRSTKPARRIIGYADGHAGYSELQQEP